MAERHPVYAGADIIVDVTDAPRETTVTQVIEALRRYLESREGAGAPRRAQL
jgi:hypothetical protein